MTREGAIKIINCYDIGFYDLSGAKIPADKLADAFDMAIEALSAEVVHKPDYSYEADMVRRLKEALSAEAVEVVRCKDCKYWKEWESRTGSCHRSENGYNWFGVGATDYCSFGERKGGDSE